MMIVEVLAFAAAIGAAVWLITVVFLTAPDHSRFDEPRHELHRSRSSVTAENQQVLQLIADMQNELRGESKVKRLFRLRRIMDDGFTGSPAEAAALGVEIHAADAAGVGAEWVVAPGAGNDRRLLYLHGGAFAVGSPRSHRMITAALSKACGIVVLAIDYRLLPENRRIRSIRDSQTAYRWILENGPQGATAASEVFVAGDSAGGNLALMLAAWARDEGPRQLDGAIAFSPSTDATLSNGAMRKNIGSDPMLGPGLGAIVRLHAAVRLPAIALAGMMSPRNPLVSPLFGDLSNLPPTLVQASDCEMLFDDCVRYVNKAHSQGSTVSLQVWPDMVHVWQMFQHVLPEARLAIDEVAVFIREHGATTN